MLDPRERAARARAHRSLFVVSCVFVCLALLVSGAWATDATIGLYQDETGSSCSFGNATGIVTAYVVVKPATGGTRSVRFSAPIPSCFAAVFLAETTPPFVVAVGSSQTGISLSHRDCQTAPFSVLTIFYQSNGGTTPCCEFPILADPFTGILEATDCAFDPQLIFANVAHFNADASCPCGLAPPGPPVPTNPTPPELSTGRPLNQTLAWQVPDPQNVTYDVYFGTSATPPLVASDQPVQTYAPGALSPSTTYRWKIVAKKSGAQYPGPVWSFSTGSGGGGESSVPSNPSPADHASSVPLNAPLSWSVSPPQNLLTFDVYFGTVSPPPLVVTFHPSTSFNPGPLLASTGYFWRIVLHDQNGMVNSGPLWTFSTAATNSPLIPSNPDPPDGGVASSSPTLSWTSSGTSFGILISLFPTMSPILTFGSSSIPQYSPGLLGAGRFYWQVFANGTVGPVWSFITTGGSVPVAFTHFDAKSSGDVIDIRWELASDEAMSGFTLYRKDGTSSQTHEVAGGAVVGTTGSYLDAAVEAGKTYRYELLVRTTDGDEFRSQTTTVTTPARALALYQNTPNPFNPQTTIRYDLQSGSTRVQLSIFDATGRNVRTLANEVQSGGSHSVIWNGRDDAGNAVSSGVYFYVLDAGKERLTRKLVLLK